MGLILIFRPHYGCLAKTVSLCCTGRAGLLNVHTAQNNYKIGVQQYVSACLTTSAGVLADDDRWKHLTSSLETHQAALLIPTSTSSACSSEHNIRTLHYDGRGAHYLLGDLKYNNQPSRKHFPKAKDRISALKCLSFWMV